MSMEIERSWVLEHINRSNWNSLKATFKSIEIEQYYIYKDEEKEIRLRRSDDKYYKCIKTKNSYVNFAREEIETQVSKNIFNKNKPKKIGNIIKKTRYITLSDTNVGGVRIEIDEFKEPKFVKGTVKMEIEFPSIAIAKEFDIDSISYLMEKICYRFKEVTEDGSWSNSYIATKDMI